MGGGHGSGRHIWGPTPADLLLVTGNLAENALPSEYRRATEFITGLAAAAGIPRRRVAIVPGSRDVNRMACEAHFAEQRSREAEPIPPYYPKWHQFVEVFGHFYEDLPDAAIAPVTFTPDEPWTLFVMRDLGIVVAGLNSTRSSADRACSIWSCTAKTAARRQRPCHRDRRCLAPAAAQAHISLSRSAQTKLPALVRAGATAGPGGRPKPRPCIMTWTRAAAGDGDWTRLAPCYPAEPGRPPPGRIPARTRRSRLIWPACGQTRI